MLKIGRLIKLIGSLFFFFSIIGCSVPAERISGLEGQKKVSNGALLVDVRTEEEFNQGHVQGATNVPLHQITERKAEFGTTTTKDIVLYCKSGGRAGKARTVLQSLGFERVYNAGGFKNWPTKVQ